MNRRDFSRIMAGTVASSLLHRSLAVQQSTNDTSTVSDQAAQLYRRALVLDCNSGPPWKGGRLPMSQVDLDMVRNCGIDVVKSPIGGLAANFAEAVEQIAYFHQLIEIHPAYFLQVRVPTDLERKGKMGIIRKRGNVGGEAQTD